MILFLLKVIVVSSGASASRCTSPYRIFCAIRYFTPISFLKQQLPHCLLSGAVAVSAVGLQAAVQNIKSFHGSDAVSAETGSDGCFNEHNVSGSERVSQPDSRAETETQL